MTSPSMVSEAQMQPEADINPAPSSIGRLAKYTAMKGLALFLTLIVGLYIAIFVVNLGGYADEIHRGQITEMVMGRLYGGWLSDLPAAERNQIAEQTIAEMEDARGLNRPFVLRTWGWLGQSLILDFGDGGAVKQTILARLPYTVSLVGLTNLAIFMVSIPLAMVLSRNRGSFLNRLIVFLSPLTFAPAWVHGVILITLFAGWWRVIPHPDTLAVFSGGLSTYTLQAMILPALAIFLSAFFQAVYTWRTFFQMHNQEDYVDLAKAKGLHPALIERRYLLRPVMPYVVTSFALLAVGLWQEAMALELLFKWPGIGSMFVVAARMLNIPFILGIVVIFAYLLVGTVFLLDILYALLDPRVRVGGESGTRRGKLVRPKLGLRSPLFQGLRNQIRAERAPRTPWRSTFSGWKFSGSELRSSLERAVNNAKYGFRAILHYPSAVIGLAGITVLVLISIYTLISIPYETAVQLWRGQVGEGYQNNWNKNPVNAPPVWVNLFRREKLPPTILLDSYDKKTPKEEAVLTEEMTQITILYSFDYQYDAIPQAISLFFESQYTEKLPLINLIWHTPDGREMELGSFRIRQHQAYYLSTDPKVRRKLGDQYVMNGLFADPFMETLTPAKGRYELEVKAFVFEPGANVDAEVVIYGQVHGLAGTDQSRRDPMLGIMWGTVLALAFGLTGAVGTSLAAMILAAVGVWFAGWVDALIQRITEVNLILPNLVILILIYTLYSKSIWAILGVLVLLNIFGNAIKSYRAVFIQAKEAPYIESARAYGASSWRIIQRYLIPRVLPILIPQIVILIPSYVFFEATLALLGIRDMYLPTWGKIIYEALVKDALLHGHGYQVLVPLGLLSMTGMAFALFGYALERMMNNSLEEI